MTTETVAAGFGLILAGVGALVIGYFRFQPREHMCPGCRSLNAFDANMESTAGFAAHTDAALRVVAENNVRQLPVQRQPGAWS